MTPTPPQTISPPQTIEPALTELTHDNPDQDVTWTHGLKHHSVTTTEPLFEPPQQTTISNPLPHIPPTPTETSSQEPETYFKHIENTDGLYEIRVQVGGDIFRIFCFFDKGKIVVIANGFQKKTQKTPKQEIAKALKIKKEYEKENE